MHFRSRDLRGSFLLVESKNGELLIGVIHNASTLLTVLSLVLKYKSETKEKNTYEQSNFEAAKTVIKNAIYCFQNSLSAQNFGLNV